MPDYKDYFTKLLDEAGPDISRNPADVQFSSDLPPDKLGQFNVDPLDPNVGFSENNITRDVEDLRKIITAVAQMAKDMEAKAKDVTKLDRSFSGINKVSNNIGRIYKELNDLAGELGRYIITLPAQKDKEEAEAQKQAANNGIQ